MSVRRDRSTPDDSSPLIHIRSLLPEDTRALEWHGGTDLRSFYEEQWRAHQAGEIHVIVATTDTTQGKNFPVGQAAIHWNGKPTHPQIPDIQSVRVHPDLRGQGLGSRLLSECEKLVSTRGHGLVSLSVAQDNDAARRLYERLGYRVVGAPYSDVWFYADAAGQSIRVEETVWDMVKNLKPL